MHGSLLLLYVEICISSLKYEYVVISIILKDYYLNVEKY